MSSLKVRLHDDLTTAMKARDEVVTATLRLALTAVTTAEVAGDAHRELADDEVLAVLGREAKRRREAAQAYAAAGRPELVAREEAELAVLARYLPAALSDAELAALVDEAVAEVGDEVGADSPRQMGAVMKALTPRIAGRADGARAAAAVRARLGG